MDQKLMFVQACERGELSMTELCDAFGIARKTGYKWLRRYKDQGPQGLEELSRAALYHPNAVERQVEDLITETRRWRRNWGPKKLLGYLEPRWPELKFPAASTVSELLRRRGLSTPRRRRPRTASYEGPFQGCTAPNDVWSIDFKGHFLTGDKKRCTPLTLSDAYSRYLLRCESTIRTDFTIVRFVLVHALEEYGLPLAIRSDNGPPFASRAPGGVSRFSVLLIKLGIRPERIEKGKPTQNGRHERIHRTLKAETAAPPHANRLAQQRAFDAFRKEYNEVRPHEALGQLAPAALYEPSPRKLTRTLVDPTYPESFETCRVRSDGTMKWNGHHFVLADVLSSELVGVERNDPTDDWTLHYGPLELGRLDAKGRFKRKPA
jgi:putative transposase